MFHGSTRETRPPLRQAHWQEQRPLKPKTAQAPKLSSWASQEIAKIAREIAVLPPGERRGAWRQKMLFFHPDKRIALDPRQVGPSEEKATEVFMEIKRRYDCIGAWKGQ